MLPPPPSTSESLSESKKSSSSVLAALTASAQKRVTPIVRLPQEHTRQSKCEQFRVFKNPDPLLHPFAAERELGRAVRAAKLERIFAKPFLGAFTGMHVEGVYALARDGEGVVGEGAVLGGAAGQLSRIASASAEGRIHVWNAATQKSTWTALDQQGTFIRGLAFVPLLLQGSHLERSQRLLLSVGGNRACLWQTGPSEDDPEAAPSSSVVETWGEGRKGAPGMTAIDAHPSRPMFATASTEQVELWSLEHGTGPCSTASHKKKPLMRLSWTDDTVNRVRFNPGQVDVLAATTATGRSLCLYDTRLGTATARVVLKGGAANGISWNPQECIYLAVASDDNRAYAFDMRFLERPVNVFSGHTNAVLDVDWSPTGHEVVTGSYDRTIRIFDVRLGGTARDIYHTSRMQRVHAVRFSGDSRFIFSASDDGNVRMWRALAHERCTPRSTRERASLEYAEALKQRHRANPQVQRILRDRNLPKYIRTATRIDREVSEAEKRKRERQAKHKPRDQADAPAPNIRSDAVLKVMH